jgi:hypothetical protein
MYTCVCSKQWCSSNVVWVLGLGTAQHGVLTVSLIVASMQHGGLQLWLGPDFPQYPAASKLAFA